MSSKKSVFEFVRERIVPINALFVFSAALVLALDRVAPKESYFIFVGAGFTAFFVLLMVADYVFDDVLRVKPISGLWMGQSRIWRSPVWQFSLASSLLIVGLGAYFEAKAGNAELTSQHESVAVLQQKLLSIQFDLRDIKLALSAVRHEDTCRLLATEFISEDGIKKRSDINALLLITQACITVHEKNLQMLKRTLNSDQGHG